MTAIEWTDATWNPVTGCSKVSPGCAHCYAETLSLRRGWSAKPWIEKNASGNVILHFDRLEMPLHWRKPRRVFVDSMSDLFHAEVLTAFLDDVFAVMALTQHLTYQILTKRPVRMLAYVDHPSTPGNVEAIVDRIAGERRWCPPPLAWPLPNVWLGVSAEYQRQADERIPILLDTPAAVRFVSVEPMLGPIDLHADQWPACSRYPDAAIDWVIVGGESGPRRRPFDPDWARSLRNQCAAAGVPLFVKQLGGARPGADLENLPPDLRIREFPAPSLEHVRGAD